MTFSVQVNFPKSFGESLAEQRRRAADLTPLNARFRQVFATQFAAYYAQAPIGDGEDDTGTLEGSLVPPQIVRAQNQHVTVGTAVDYAAFYAESQRRKGRPELIPATDQVMSAFSDTVLDWILEGRN
jgi:hypothetical protein